MIKQCKRIGRRLLFPGLAVVLVSIPVAAGLLVHTFVFAAEPETSPLTYFSYVFSAYSLTISCAWIGKHARGAKRTVTETLHKHHLVHRYLTEVPFKVHVSLYLSLGINLLYAGMNLFFGVRYRSVWFGTLAVYYSMLAIMRFLLLRHVNRNEIGSDLRAELRRYRLCGIILMLLNIALSGVVILVVQQNEGFAYAGYLIYVIALYAFYNIISAVRDVIKYRKYQSPVMSASKAIKLAAALVSMLSLETAMLAQFDAGTDPLARQAMTAMTGGGVCVFILVMAAVMIVVSTRRLKAIHHHTS